MKFANNSPDLSLFTDRVTDGTPFKSPLSSSLVSYLSHGVFSSGRSKTVVRMSKLTSSEKKDNSRP